MKNFFSTIIVLFLFSTFSFAQFESIDLNKYKLTDYKYQSLSTYLNASNTNEYLNSNTYSNKNKLNSSGSLNYSSTKYSRKYIGNNSFGFSAGSSFNKDDNSNQKTTNKVYGLTLNVNSYNSFYTSNNFFYGIDFQSIQSPLHSTSNTTYPVKTTSFQNYFGSYNSFKFKVGTGRIENVTDARLAIYILDDLLKQNRLTRTPSEEEVIKFADLITQILNKRVIDNRIKQIKEFVDIDSFLVSNGLSSKMDGLSFGLINDNWNYARTQYWGTGSVWQFGVSPSIQYSNSFYKENLPWLVSKQRSELTRYCIGFDASYSLRKIAGLKWIKGYNIYGSFNIYKYDNSGYSGDVINCNQIIASTTYFLSYIPNTRTSINLATGVFYFKNLSKDYNKQVQVNPLISGTCNYYISEKLRLNIDADISYDFYKLYDPMSTDKSLTLGLYATLNYYIF